jgi:cAMP-dependent protein kinase regulator
LALLYNTPRAATIEAMEDSVLFSMSRYTFNGIIKEKAIKQREKYDRFLSTVNLFENLCEYE